MEGTNSEWRKLLIVLKSCDMRIVHYVDGAVEFVLKDLHDFMSASYICVPSPV